MKDVAALAIICLCIAFCVGCCTYSGVEATRTLVEAKTACFDNGGEWDGWTAVCRRPAL